MRLTKTHCKEIRSVLSKMGWRNHIKELGQRVTDDGRYTLNYSDPDQVDLADLTAPEYYVGHDLDLIDGVIDLDFWLYRDDYLVGNASVFGYQVGRKMIWLDHEPSQSEKLKLQVKHQGK